MTLDSFKQLWERIFFKCNGYIFKNKPSSNVKASICPIDRHKPTRCCYLGPPLHLWMEIAEAGGSCKGCHWLCPAGKPLGSWAPGQPTCPPRGDQRQGWCQSPQGPSLISPGSLVGRCCRLLGTGRRLPTSWVTAEGVWEISLTYLSGFHESLPSPPASPGRISGNKENNFQFLETPPCTFSLDGALYARGSLSLAPAINEGSHHIAFLRYLLQTTGRIVFFVIFCKLLTNPKAFCCMRRICIHMFICIVDGLLCLHKTKFAYTSHSLNAHLYPKLACKLLHSRG